METSTLWKIIRKRYCNPEWALLEEVRNGAGAHANRSADGIAMSLWPSRGLEMIGIETKVSRADWLLELKNPAKAEAIAKYCDRWWVIAGDDKVAKVEEVPVTWGLMVAKGTRLIEVKPAPKLTPEPIPRSFLAALLKRATTNMIPADSIEDRLIAARQEGREVEKKSNGSYETALKEQTAMIKEFEEITGASLADNGTWYSIKHRAAAYKFVLEHGGVEGMKKELKRMAMDIKIIQGQAAKFSAVLDSALSNI